MASLPTSSDLKRAHSPMPNISFNDDEEIPKKVMSMMSVSTAGEEREEKQVPTRPRMSIYGPHFKYGPNRITPVRYGYNSSDDSDLSDVEDDQEEEEEEETENEEEEENVSVDQLDDMDTKETNNSESSDDSKTD